MVENKRKRGRKPKSPAADTTTTLDFQYTNQTTSTTSSAAVNDVVSVPTSEASDLGGAQPSRRSRGRPRKGEEQTEKEKQRSNMAVASPERRSSRHVEQNGEGAHLMAVVAEPPLTVPKWENVARVVPSMDAVVKVFCVHTEPNFSLPWQRKRQYSSSSSGFIIKGRRVLTNAHSVEHHTQVKLKKRGSDTKYLATVLAIGTECDIGM